MALSRTITRLKTDLGISTSARDEGLADHVAACLRDLEITAGVIDPDETDPWVLSAIKLYARAAFTDDTEKAAAYMQRYNAIKASMQMAAGYGGDQDGD